MSQLPQTPSQTIGPFFAYGLTARQYGYDYTSLLNDHLLDTEKQMGLIQITGQILDGAGTVVPDALIELWQADASGEYTRTPLPYPDEPLAFKGIGRLGTGTTPGARFTFTTIKPGSPGPGEAPHIDVMLLMRGSLRTLHTRLYFSDETDANEHDELLNSVAPDRRDTLIAQHDGGSQYRFDIHLQGERETVFFDL